MPVTYLPHFSRLERLTLEIARADTPREELSRSFSAVQSTLSFVDSAPLKHLVMRLDYNRTPSVEDQKVLEECHNLEQLLLGRKLDSIVISLANARRHRGNLDSIIRAYHRLFPALFEQGLLTVIPGAYPVILGFNCVSSAAKEADTRLAGHESPVTALAVSPDSRFVASASNETIIIWDAQTRRAIREWSIYGATNGANILAFSPCQPGTIASHRVASCGGEMGRIAVWDVTQGRPLEVLAEHFRPIRTCVWSPDGTRLASGGEDGTVCIWDAETHVKLHACGYYYGSVYDVLFSPDGQWVVTSSGTRTLRVWDAMTGEGRVTLPLGDTVNAMVYHPDGVQFALASGASGVHVFKIISDSRGMRFQEVLSTGRHVEPWTFENTPQAIAFSKDGTMLLWAGWNAPISYGVLVKVWDARSGRLLSRLWICAHDQDPVHAVSFSPDGKYVAISASRSGRVTVWRTEEREEAPTETFTEHSVDVGDCWATHVAFSPDGSILASGARDGSVFIRPSLNIPTPPNTQ